MKITRVRPNSRRRGSEVSSGQRNYIFPYAKLTVRPAPGNKIRTVCVDRELGREAFTYVLESGEEGTVHLDAVLNYNRDPAYMRDLLLYKLTLEAQRQVRQSPLSRRELIRRLRASPVQFDRLLDQTNNKKSVDQLLSLLRVLDCDVDLVVKERAA